MKRICPTFVLAILCVFSCVLSAKAEESSGRVKATLAELLVSNFSVAAVHPAGMRPVAQSQRVVVLVTSWCPYCKRLEAFLQNNHIDYQRYDVERDAVGRKMHEQLGGGSVPVIIVGSTVIRGFSPEDILGALSAGRSSPHSDSPTA